MPKRRRPSRSSRQSSEEWRHQSPPPRPQDHIGDLNDRPVHGRTVLIRAALAWESNGKPPTLAPRATKLEASASGDRDEHHSTWISGSAYTSLPDGHRYRAENRRGAGHRYAGRRFPAVRG